MILPNLGLVNEEKTPGSTAENLQKCLGQTIELPVVRGRKYVVQDIQNVTEATAPTCHPLGMGSHVLANVRNYQRLPNLPLPHSLSGPNANIPKNMLEAKMVIMAVGCLVWEDALGKL